MRKGDRLKNNLSQRTNLNPATTIFDIIAEINATMKIQKSQIEISTTQEIQMEIPTAKKIQKRQNENIWFSDGEKEKKEDEEQDKKKKKDGEDSESLFNNSIEITNSPISTFSEYSRTSTFSPSRRRVRRSPNTLSRRTRLSLSTKSRRYRRSATPERPPPPQTISEAGVAPLQPTFKPLRHATLSKIPRRSEKLLQAREASASLRIVENSKIPRPSPETQKQKATSVQEKNTIIIENITSRYSRVRRRRRL
jgi:hypothetical protein